eukprot:7841047-Pyramimonas_sp.AAC.1
MSVRIPPIGFGASWVALGPTCPPGPPEGSLRSLSSRLGTMSGASWAVLGRLGALEARERENTSIPPTPN